MSSGDNIMWVDELRYLRVYIVHSHVFKCSLDKVKKSFYRAANSVFGKIGRIASEEVTLQIMDSKCIPMLLYACPLLNEVRQVIFRLCNRPILHETLSNKLY